MIVYMGLLMSPFVIGSAIWWLLTGRRLPGVLGNCFPPPTTVSVTRGGLAPDMRAFLDRSKPSNIA